MAWLFELHRYLIFNGEMAQLLMMFEGSDFKIYDGCKNGGCNGEQNVWLQWLSKRSLQWLLKGGLWCCWNVVCNGCQNVGCNCCLWSKWWLRWLSKLWGNRWKNVRCNYGKIGDVALLKWWLRGLLKQGEMAVEMMGVLASASGIHPELFWGSLTWENSNWFGHGQQLGHPLESRLLLEKCLAWCSELHRILRWVCHSKCSEIM